MNQDDFETLLSKKTHIVEDIPVVDEKPQKADKNASLDNFIEMIAKLVSKTMDNVIFKPDEGARIIVDPDLKLDKAYVTFDVIDRKPELELKPRIRETFVEKDDKGNETGRYGNVYGQVHKCVIQFNVFAAEYKTANAVMNNFEDMMFAYSHFLKRNGVRELYFQRHFTDYNYNTFRQTTSVRSLWYYVELEKLNVIYEGEITDITIK